MKKSFILFSVFALTLLTACSDDDANLNANQSNTDLLRTETLLGASDAVVPGQTVMLKQIQHYEQGKIVGDTIFDLAGNYYYYTIRQYSGNTHSEQTHKANGALNSTYTKTYDSNGRITLAEYTSSFEYRKYVMSYATNGDVTVDITNTLGGLPYPVNYTINQNGFISNMSFPNETLGLTYVNGRPATHTHTANGFSSSISYFYYNTASLTPPDAITLNNYILEKGGLSAAIEIIPEFKGILNQTYYDKTFDSQGRITRSKMIINGGYPDISYYY